MDKEEAWWSSFWDQENAAKIADENRESNSDKIYELVAEM